MQHLSPRHRRLVPVSVWDLPDPDADVADAVLRRLEAERVLAAVGSLPAFQRLLVRAAYGLGVGAVSGSVLADCFGLASETIEALLERARARLRAALDAEDAPARAVQADAAATQHEIRAAA